MSGIDIKVKIIQHLLAGHIREVHIAKGNDALRSVHAAFAALVLLRLIHDGEHPLRARNGSLYLAVKLGNLINGPSELLGIYDERGNHADGYHAVNREISAEGSNNNETYVIDYIHYRSHGSAEALRNDSDLRQLIRGLLELLDHLALVIIGNHSLISCHHLLHGSVQISEKHLTPAEEQLHLPGQIARSEDRKNHRNTREQRKLRAQPYHHEHGSDNRQNPADQRA